MKKLCYFRDTLLYSISMENGQSPIPAEFRVVCGVGRVFLEVGATITCRSCDQEQLAFLNSLSSCVIAM